MPRSATKKTVEFRLYAPEATQVQLVGEFTQWLKLPLQMSRGAEGVWTATVSLKSGEYAYRYLVDGAWVDDPECPRRVPNPFGTENCVCRVA